jgi:hypothetical protein
MPRVAGGYARHSLRPVLAKDVIAQRHHGERAARTRLRTTAADPRLIAGAPLRLCGVHGRGRKLLATFSGGQQQVV